MKYSEETRMNALASMKEIGVNATAEKMSIAKQTLYKWQRKSQSSNAGNSSEDALAAAQSTLELITKDEEFEKRIAKLETENARLLEQLAAMSARQQVDTARYQSKIAALTSAVKALLDRPE